MSTRFLETYVAAGVPGHAVCMRSPEEEFHVEEAGPLWPPAYSVYV